MEFIPWWVFALYVSVMGAVSNDINARAKLDGLTIKVTNGFISGLLLTPALFIIPLPENSGFYISLLIAALLLSITEVKGLNITAKYGGAFSSLGRPITILFAFLIWNIVSTESAIQIIKDRWALIGVITSFTLLGLSKFIFFKKSNVDIRRGLVDLIFLSFLTGLITIVIKYAMDFTMSLWQAIIWTCLLNYAISFMAIIRVILTKGRSIKSSFSWPLIRVSSSLGFFTAIIAPVTTLSIATAPNPAFSSAIFMLSTVWLAGYYKLKNRPTNLQPLAATLLILSALILIFSTAGLS